MGTSASLLMRAESKLEFGRMLERARTGLRASFKHGIHNKRGQTLHAQTTIYPGDAAEGQKPTFLVAQTRLLKLSRTPANSTKHVQAVSSKTDQASTGSDSPSTQVSGATGASHQSGASESSVGNKAWGDSIITQPGGSGLPIGNQSEYELAIRVTANGETE